MILSRTQNKAIFSKHKTTPPPNIPYFIFALINEIYVGYHHYLQFISFLCMKALKASSSFQACVHLQ